MRPRHVPLAAATAGLALVLTATPASADTSQSSKAGSGAITGAARANFVSHGEHLFVEDRDGDGHSVLARYWLADGTGPHIARNPDGNGSRKDFNLDLAEGTWIFYQVCVSEGTTPLAGTCSAGVTDYA